MYDSHIYCREHKELKDHIVDIVNGEMEATVYKGLQAV